MGLPRHLAILSKSQLESMCLSCGACCRPAVPIAKGVNALIPELHCKYLKTASDGETSCTVYDQRLDVAKGWCNQLEDALQKGLFPDLCPYVVDIKGYVGTVVLDKHTYGLVKPQIRKAIVGKGKPEWVSDELWKSYVEEDNQ